MFWRATRQDALAIRKMPPTHTRLRRDSGAPGSRDPAWCSRLRAGPGAGPLRVSHFVEDRYNPPPLATRGSRLARPGRTAAHRHGVGRHALAPAGGPATVLAGEDRERPA